MLPRAQRQKLIEGELSEKSGTPSNSVKSRQIQVRANVIGHPFSPDLVRDWIIDLNI
jgi:hypothetical protein